MDDPDELTDPTTVLDFGCDPEEVIRRIETFTYSFLQSLAEGRAPDIQLVNAHFPEVARFISSSAYTPSILRST